MKASEPSGRGKIKVNEAGLAQAAIAKLVVKYGPKVVQSAMRNLKPIPKKMTGPKSASDLAKLKQALGKKTVTKKETRPDSPFLKFVEPKRKNTAAIQQTLKKLKENKNTPNNVTKLADYKKRKFRGK